VQWWEGQTDRARSPNTDFATSVAQHAPPEIKVRRAMGVGGEG